MVLIIDFVLLEKIFINIYYLVITQIINKNDIYIYYY